MLGNLKELEENFGQLDSEIEAMLSTLFKLVKECVSRNIPPSVLVKDCNLSIDEAALHKSAFELHNVIARVD